MGVRRAASLGLLIVAVCVASAEARVYPPPPPAADLAAQVLTSAEAVGSALAEEGARTAIVPKDLQGSVVDAEDGITNATICQLGCKLTESCSGWKFCPGPAKCKGEAIPGGGVSLYSVGSCLLLNFPAPAEYALDTPDAPGNGWVSGLDIAQAAGPTAGPLDAMALGAELLPVEEGSAEMAAPAVAPLAGEPLAGPTLGVEAPELPLGAEAVAGPEGALMEPPAAAPGAEFIPITSASVAMGAQSALDIPAFGVEGPGGVPALALGGMLPSVATPPGAVLRNLQGTPLLPPMVNTEICATACNALAACDGWKYCTEGECPNADGTLATPGVCQLVQFGTPTRTAEYMEDTTPMAGDGWMSGVSVTAAMAPAPATELAAPAPSPVGRLASPCAAAPFQEYQFDASVTAPSADECSALCSATDRCTGFNFFCGMACMSDGAPGVCNLLLPAGAVAVEAPLAAEGPAPEAMGPEMGAAPIPAAAGPDAEYAELDMAAAELDMAADGGVPAAESEGLAAEAPVLATNLEEEGPLEGIAAAPA